MGTSQRIKSAGRILLATFGTCFILILMNEAIELMTMVAEVDASDPGFKAVVYIAAREFLIDTVLIYATIRITITPLLRR
jgi:hypothetical protein